MEKVLKNPVVVVNKTGAAGAVGMSFVANSKPDGYNLNTLRTHEALSGNVEPLVWGLEQILKFAEVLLRLN